MLREWKGFKSPIPQTVNQSCVQTHSSYENLCMILCKALVFIHYRAVFPEPRFSGGQLTPAFENRGSMQIFEGQLGLTPSS